MIFKKKNKAQRTCPIGYQAILQSYNNKTEWYLPGTGQVDQ